MNNLFGVLLALAIVKAPPARSPYSFEAVPECGNDRTQPLCELARVCDEASFRCAPPKWSSVRNAWVKVETEQAAVRRYAKIMAALVRVSKRLLECDVQQAAKPTSEATKPTAKPATDAAESTTKTAAKPAVQEETGCLAKQWPGTTRELALAGLTVALHESGLREDIQFGYPPLGRGPAGEVCLLQVALDQAPLHAFWLEPDVRKQIAFSREQRKAFAEGLLGDSELALERCMEVGLRMLVRARRACSLSDVPWDQGMFAMYGTGRTCHLPKMASKRQRTFRGLLAARPKLNESVRELLDSGTLMAEIGVKQP